MPFESADAYRLPEPSQRVHVAFWDPRCLRLFGRYHHRWKFPLEKSHRLVAKRLLLLH